MRRRLHLPFTVNSLTQEVTQEAIFSYRRTIQPLDCRIGLLTDQLTNGFTPRDARLKYQLKHSQLCTSVPVHNSAVCCTVQP